MQAKLAERALPVEARADEPRDLGLPCLLQVRELAVGPKRVRDLLDTLLLGLDLRKLVGPRVDLVRRQDEREHAQKRGSKRTEQDVGANAADGLARGAGSASALVDR